MKPVILLVFCLLAIGIGAVTINVPEDYATIQEGIDESVDGDRVLVAPGTYLENINFNGKGITVGSWFCTTQDTSYIYQTVIDGNEELNVVQFSSNSELAGFTIRNGYAYCGGGIICWYVQDSVLESLIIENNESPQWGGGIYCSYSNLSINNTIISDNHANDAGGGIYCQNSELVLESVTIKNNSGRNTGGGLACSDTGLIVFSNEYLCSIYDNNLTDSDSGNDIYSEIEISVYVDTFTVSEPEEFHASPLDNFTFSIQHGLHNPWEIDLYVSPDGDDSNNGYTPDQPLQTIHHASTKIVADSSHVRTIHLLPGIYSPSANNEVFPVEIPDYVILSGEDEDSVILDAENTSSVIRIYDDQCVSLMNATLINGEYNAGGGILCENDASLYLENVTIRDNYASFDGGGIYSQSGSHLVLYNVIITNNSSVGAGGIYGHYSNLEMENVEISYNLSFDAEKGIGGGIYVAYGSADLDNVVIEENYAINDGGGIYSNGDIHLEDVIIRNNVCLGYGAGICCEGTVNLEIIDSSIEGNYSADRAGGIYCYGSYLNMTMTGGEIINNSADYGGGLYAYLCDPFLDNVLIANNSATNSGAAVYLNNSSNLSLVRSSLIHNMALINGGGVFCIQHSSVMILNSILWENLPHQVCSYHIGVANQIMVGYSDIGGGIDALITNDNANVFWMEGNIDADPLFVDPENESYLLQEDSPCIDAGIDYYEFINTVLIDVDEDEYYGSTPDMGAFEYGMVETDEFKIENVIHPGGQECKISNYPNPFNPETAIAFYIQQSGKVKLAVYNVKGQKVRTLLNEIRAAGEQKLVWQGTDNAGRKVSSGIYFIRLDIDEQKGQWRKIVLMK